MGEIFVFCRIQLKFRFWLYKKRWHTSWKFQSEKKTSNKKVITKKPLTNLYEMNSSPSSLSTKEGRDYCQFESIWIWPGKELNQWCTAPHTNALSNHTNESYVWNLPTALTVQWHSQHFFLFHIIYYLNKGITKPVTSFKTCLWRHPLFYSYIISWNVQINAYRPKSYERIDFWTVSKNIGQLANTTQTVVIL